MFKFFLDIKNELTKVEWLSAKDTAIYTAVVIGASVIIGALIAGLDLTFFKLRDVLLSIG